MSEPSLRLENRVAEAVFLDVHMEGIEEDFTVWAFHSFGEGDPLRGGVHDKVLETINDFEAEDDPAVFRRLDGLTHAFDGSVGCRPLVFARKEFARPGA